MVDDEPVAFEAAERDGEHSLADSLDVVLELGESSCSVAEEVEDEEEVEKKENFIFNETVSR